MAASLLRGRGDTSTRSHNFVLGGIKNGNLSANLLRAVFEYRGF